MGDVVQVLHADNLRNLLRLYQLIWRDVAQAEVANQSLMLELGEHCQREGRDYASIEKTIVTRFDPGPSGERADQEVERLGRFSGIGVQAALGYLVGCEDPRVMEVMATKVIPQVERL